MAERAYSNYQGKYRLKGSTQSTTIFSSLKGFTQFVKMFGRITSSLMDFYMLYFSDFWPERRRTFLSKMSQLQDNIIVNEHNAIEEGTLREKIKLEHDTICGKLKKKILILT